MGTRKVKETRFTQPADCQWDFSALQLRVCMGRAPCREMSFLAASILGRSSFSSAGMGCRHRNALQGSCWDRSAPAWVLGWENIWFWASPSALAAVECFHGGHSGWWGALRLPGGRLPAGPLGCCVLWNHHPTENDTNAWRGLPASASLQITSVALLWTPSLIFGGTCLLTPASWEQLCWLGALRGARGQLPTGWHVTGLQLEPGWAADPLVLRTKCKRCARFITVRSIPLPGKCEDPNSTLKKKKGIEIMR